MLLRKANLDLLRAVAILGVIFFHISQYTNVLGEYGQKIASLGAYGVDIFFVLSGWLIGSIYFREYRRNNRVDLVTFWGRRWLRTLPPYYVALAVSWAAVYVSRQQPFEVSYLIFTQNYAPLPPFFLVSWSLCIEEHFYLFMPLIILLGLRFNCTVSVCLFFIFLSVGCRLYNHIGSYPPFGYLVTATHLRLDGLTLGILSAYVYTVKQPNWFLYSKSIKIIGPFAGIAAVFMYLTNHPFMYSAGLFLLPLFFLSLLCLSVDTKDWPISRLKFISPIALSSYSLYLTNALVINIVNSIVNERGYLYIITLLSVIFCVGYGFYRTIELPSIKIRDKLLPVAKTSVAKINS